MTLGHKEDIELTQYLNKLLDEMPLSEPSPMLTDRIMQSIGTVDTSTPAGNPQRSMNRPWMNGAIAIAATVLLIQSGMIGRIVNIAAGITQLTGYIQNLSQYL
jgi:hypothetical protein